MRISNVINAFLQLAHTLLIFCSCSMAASSQGVNEIFIRDKTRRSGNQSLKVQNFQENLLAEWT